MFIYLSVLSFAKKIVRFWNCVLSQIAFDTLIGSWSAETSWKAEKSGEIAAAVLPISQI